MKQPSGNSLAFSRLKEKGTDALSGRNRYLAFSPASVYNKRSFFYFFTERLIAMSATKKQPPITRKQQQGETVNKRALIWTGAIFVVIVVAMAVLLIWNG